MSSTSRRGDPLQHARVQIQRDVGVVCRFQGAHRPFSRGLPQSQRLRTTWRAGYKTSVKRRDSVSRLKKDIPAGLVKKIVTFRVKENQEQNEGKAQEGLAEDLSFLCSTCADARYFCDFMAASGSCASGLRAGLHIPVSPGPRQSNRPLPVPSGPVQRPIGLRFRIAIVQGVHRGS